MQIASNFARLLLAAVSIQTSISTTPLFIEQPTYTNEITEIKAINNAGDILVNAEVANGSAYPDGPVLIRQGQVHALYPTGTPNINSVIATGLSERRPDGSIYIAGTSIMKDGFWRASLWDVAPDGSITSFRTMPNIFLPEDSSAPGEQSKGYGMAVNTSGVLVGSGQSYLAGLATVWRPPYANAVRYLLSTGSEFFAVREDGFLAANGVEFDHGNSLNRYAAAVLFEGGLPQEVPLLYPVTTLWPNRITSMRGEWVAGIAQSPSAGRAFAWRIGSAQAFELPGPANLPLEEDQGIEICSINSHGHAIGFINGGRYGRTPIYWHYSDGKYTAYNFNELLPGTTAAFSVEFNILNNDSGEVVLMERTWNGATMRLFKPLSDGIVNLVNTFASAEEGRPLEFKVKLHRAIGNNSVVTVRYQTQNDTATAPADYETKSGTITWLPGQSGEKTVFIPTKDNTTIGTGDHSFKLVLSDAAGAQLGQEKEGTAYITEPWQDFSVRNQVLVGGWMQGCAVLHGQSEALIKVQRTGGSDGSITFSNFKADFSTAKEGEDFLIPENLEMRWEVGDTSIKTIRLPLLNTETPITESKTIYLSATGTFDGTDLEIPFAANIYIQPHVGDVQPLIYPAAVQKTIESISMSIGAMQGTIIQLEKALGSFGDWSKAAEAESVDGEVQLEVPLNPQEKAAFFRVIVKQE